MLCDCNNRDDGGVGITATGLMWEDDDADRRAAQRISELQYHTSSTRDYLFITSVYLCDLCGDIRRLSITFNSVILRVFRVFRGPHEII